MNIKKIGITLSFFAFLLSGCTIGENPDTKEFEVQYKAPNMEDGIDDLFENKGEVPTPEEPTDNNDSGNDQGNATEEIPDYKIQSAESINNPDIFDYPIEN